MNNEHDLTSPARQQAVAPDIDLTAKGPLRLGVAYRQTVWLDTPGDLIRVRAPDLRALSRQVAAAREQHPGRDVVVDIDVVIACDAASARAALAEAGDPPDPTTLLYVGTACGLAGLVADLYALGMTNGAILIPLTGDGVVDLIREEVLPELHSLTATPAYQSSQPRPA